MSGAQTIDEALDTGQALFDGILSQTGDLLKDKRVLAIGAGLLAAGTVRYMMQHPELIKEGMTQAGNVLDREAETSQQGMDAAGKLAIALAPAIVAALGPAVVAGITALGGAATVGLGAATAIPVVPPPP